MAVTGIHAIINTPEPDALRAVFADVFGWPSVHAHPEETEGRLANWLLFALPPAELGVHPADDTQHSLLFMCDDIAATIADLRSKGIEFIDEVQDMGWSLAITMRLPGGVEVLLYEPRHVTAIDIRPSP
jgi:hypothetical protein